MRYKALSFVGHISILCVAFLFSLNGYLSAQSHDKLTIRYLPPEEGIGSESTFYSQILKLALEKTIPEFGEYDLVPADKAVNQNDALKELMAGKQFDIVHTMTNKTRERVLIPIRIPLTKGLIGARLVLIKKEQRDTFASVKTMKDLRAFTFIQGSDWPDTEILKFNNLNVKTSDEYLKLFDLLAEENQKLAFPRAVFEIWDEMQTHKEHEFEVAPGFYLYYPAAMYFFVRKDKNGMAIAKRVEAGLRMAIQDGSFDALFNIVMKPYLDKADLANRIGIKLKNPLLPDETPLNDPDLWYLKD